jgi:hypothetical protein
MAATPGGKDHKSAELWQPLPFFARKWESISMDLITALPKMHNSN